MTNKKERRITVRMAEDLHAKFELFCRSHGISMSKAINGMALVKVRKYGVDNAARCTICEASLNNEHYCEVCGAFQYDD